MKVDFYSDKTGNFSVEVPEDENIYLLSGGNVPTKEMLQENIVNYFKHDGCRLGTRSISDVSNEESVRRIKTCIDTYGIEKTLYNMYHYAEMSQGSDLYLYGSHHHFDFDYLLEGKECCIEKQDNHTSNQDRVNQDHDEIEMG